MNIIQTFLQELEKESTTTHKMLSVVPDGKYDWRPHPKSMNIKALTTHIAELPTWITYAANTDELDFATTPYNPRNIQTTAELLEFFEASLAEGKTSLLAINEDKLEEKWTLRNGEQIYQVFTKATLIRHILSQIIHHRAQLGVFLRLLDVPIPGSYGPSADDQSF